MLLKKSLLVLHHTYTLSAHTSSSFDSFCSVMTQLFEDETLSELSQSFRTFPSYLPYLPLSELYKDILITTL